MCVQFSSFWMYTALYKKIRIGNVLKSADVGTLFSRRNSENTSHTHAYPRTPAHTGTYPCTPSHTCTHPRTPMHTLTHTRAHPRTLSHTRTHSRTPHTYPLMSADALNLINHIKLHVNGKMAER